MTIRFTEHSKHLRGKDLADREERQAMRERGILLQPRYREKIGPTPVLAPGDVNGAKSYLDKVVHTLQHGGWTRDERNRLKRIKRKWVAKAEGTDKWFMEHGNPIGGEEGNDYGRKGYEQERRRDRIRTAVQAANQEYERRIKLSGSGGGDSRGIVGGDETKEA